MILEVKGLKVGFEAETAVDGIDFAVGEDEVVGLVGESGSGKTVTALSVMRLLPAGGRIEGGSILFERDDLLKLSERDMLEVRGRSISMIFQEPFTSLNPVLRIGEQISEVMAAHGALSKKAAYDETLRLLRMVRIDDPERVFYDYPHRLSGGQRQRVMIATALALKPRILIADEPTTALDVTIQSEILQLLIELKREFGTAVLFITHDFGVVNEIADRVLVMKAGKIVEEGRKNELLRSPRHPYTKRLLDAIPKIAAESEYLPSCEKPFISIESLSKTFDVERGVLRKKVGEVRAVDDVNLSLGRGETLGLVGESASGKTTLGRLILGLTEADSGRVLVEGRELKDLIAKTPKMVRRMMQIVFQDPYGSLDPHMRMGDIVLEGPAVLGVESHEREWLLKDVLEKVRLDYADRLKYPHQFSGGQRQRIAVARALAVRPKFLVLDEPVSSLDVSIQADILELLRGLQKQLELTYLFISHDLRVVGAVSDWVAVMHKGRIVEFNSRNAIYASPQHPYTKRLLSSILSLG